MITEDNICDLEEILEKINTSDEIKITDFSKKVENPEKLFKALTIVNKTKIKQLLKSKDSDFKAKIIHDTYDKKTAIHIINETSSDMLTNYTISQLKALYIAVCDGCKPRSNISKESLIKILKQLIKSQIRGKNFSDL